jgi:hypothetical protein
VLIPGLLFLPGLVFLCSLLLLRRKRTAAFASAEFTVLPSTRLF